ncbi:MAG: sulfatase [Cyclobacteriaceae bacterium]
MKTRRLAKYRILIITAFILSGVAICKAQEIDKPNVIILFVDDLGWADLGYRNPKFDTPNINKLKEDGMEFTRAYVPTPTCSPSRASILTGKEAIRLEMPRHITHDQKDGSNSQRYNYWPTDPSNRRSINWLPLKERTYAEYLKEQGYYNLFIGKWHLGSEFYHPIYQGFDEQYGTSNWGHPNGYYQRFFRSGKVLKDIPEDEYLSDVLTDKAVDFIRNYESKKPFQLSFWYYNVHAPHQGRNDLVKKYQSRGLTDKDAEYAAMVESVDESVGRIRKELENQGLDKNTVILFISDQGGFFSNAPLSGGKIGGNTLGEGGARIPFIAYYPDVTDAGSICETPIQTIDVFPTLIDMVSGEQQKKGEINGVSLLPLLKGNNIPERDLHFFRAYEDQSSAIIRGDWKLIKYLSGKYQLFNLRQDLGEKTDLIDKEQKIAKRLKKALSKWETEAVPKLE